MADTGKPRLMYMITRAEHGGAQSHVLDLVSGFRNDFEISVAVGEEGCLTDSCRAKSIPVHIVPHLCRDVTPWSDIRALFGMVRLLRRERPHLVHTHTWKAGFLGRLAARLCGIPCIYTVHMWHFGPETPRTWRAFGPALERAVSGLCERIITVSRWSAEVGRSVTPPASMTVIFNGIADSPERASSTAATVSLVVMVARFNAFKDHEILLRAFAQVGTAARLMLIGDGPTRASMEQLAAELGIGDRVEFMGDRSDVPRLLSAADIFVLASRYEHFPISILEAMRAGLPVIASEVGGIPELVVQGKTGLLVAPHSAPEMAKALTELIENQPKRVGMGRYGRLRYEARFSLHHMIDDTRTVYADVLSLSRTREPAAAWPVALESDQPVSSPKS